MHPEDIKAAIRKAGSSQAAIARELNVTNMAVTHAIRGNKSSRIARRISEITGKRFSELWPGKYRTFEFAEALQTAHAAAPIAAKAVRSQQRRKAAV